MPWLKARQPRTDRPVRDLTLSPRLSTRLLVPFVATVATIMAAYGGWSLAERERALRVEGDRETAAYATALGIGLEYAFADKDLREVSEITTRISREPKIYGVVVYGPDALPLVASSPLSAADALAPSVVQEVLRTGQVVSLDRSLHGGPFHSVVRPIRAAQGRVVGAFETAQPLSGMAAEVQRARWKLLTTTLVLIVALFLIMQWFLRRVITQPVEGFLRAVRALQQGDLSHRVDSPLSNRELGALAEEFNTMAGRLQSARDQLIHETQERLALERRLQETEKLAVIGQLAAGLAHEIGTPLNVIAGRAEMLLRREADPDRQRKLRIIIQQIDRIARIVRNLLGFARRREPHFEETDLGQIVDAVLEFLEAELSRAQVTVERAGVREARAEVDANLIHDLVLNLVMNAIHALEAIPEERRITVRLLEIAAPQDLRVIEVEDNGPGIDQAVMPHLFEPFYTTKPGGMGTGLGLPMAKAVVEEHGGTLEAFNVDDAVGRNDERHGGALFRVTLPAHLEVKHA